MMSTLNVRDCAVLRCAKRLHTPEESEDSSSLDKQRSSKFTGSLSAFLNKHAAMRAL